jgi:hypothetical protein
MHCSHTKQRWASKLSRARDESNRRAPLGQTLEQMPQSTQAWGSM